MGIKLRLLALVLVAAVPVFGLEAWHEVRAARHRVAEIDHEIRQVARVAAAEQDLYFEAARNVLATYLEAPTVRRTEAAACGAYLARLHRIFPAFTGFGVATPEGTIVCSSDPVWVGASLKDRDYFQAALGEDGFAVGTLTRGAVSERQIVGMAHPLLDPSGELRLVGILGLDLQHLSRETAVPELRPGTVVTILDAAGTIIARAPGGEEWIGRQAPEPTGEPRLDAGGGELVEIEDVDGVRRLFGFTRLLDAHDITLGVGVPLAPLQAEAREALLARIVPLIVVFLLAASIAWIGGDVSIRRPLKVLQRGIDRITGGDLTVRSGALSSVPEFARLGRSLDVMAERLERREADLQRALGDKELLLREMNHRVKNGLQLVSSMLTLQAHASRERDLRGQLAQAQARVLTVARVHERLYQGEAIGRVDFAQYLHELCDDIGKGLVLGESESRIALEAAPIELGVDAAVHLGLIANELITNALKYAYPDGRPGEVAVRLATCAAGRCRLEVEDHGVGLPEDFECREGLGLRLVRAFVEQRQGCLQIDRKPAGCRFVVLVPL